MALFYIKVVRAQVSRFLPVEELLLLVVTLRVQAVAAVEEACHCFAAVDLMATFHYMFLQV